MASFEPKASKNVSFLTFSTFRFYSLERCFLVLEYRKHIFVAYNALKKKVEKWSFFDQNHGLTLFKNVNIWTFWTLCFYSLERCFLVLQYRKRLFPGLYWLLKKVRKKALFWPKPWVNLLEKCQFFDFLNFSFL